jgi:hypothetical protein
MCGAGAWGKTALNTALNTTLNATKTPPKHHQITACPRLTLKLKPAVQASDHKKA